MCSTVISLAVRWHRRADCTMYGVIHRTAALRRVSILATVEVRMDGDLRDVRTSPESPAPRPDVLFNPVLSLLSPLKLLLFFISPGTGLTARSTHLFLKAIGYRLLANP
jgi:hypothetical protein